MVVKEKIKFMVTYIEHDEYDNLKSDDLTYEIRNTAKSVENRIRHLMRSGCTNFSVYEIHKLDFDVRVNCPGRVMFHG